MFNYCPNCQSQNITSANQHRFFCSDCQFEYFHNAAATVAGILLCQDKILFTVRGREPGKGKLDLPGGFVDHNESLEQALTREFQEEVGLTINHWQYLESGFNTYEYAGIQYATCDGIFLAELEQFPDIQIDNDEIINFVWLNKHEIDIQEMAFVSLQQAVARYLS